MTDPAPVSSGSRFALRNWRVATRLYAILLIPVIAAAVLGGFRVESAVETWQEADDQVRTAELVRAALGYNHALMNERDLTVVPLLAGDRDNSKVIAARKATDEAADDFDAAVMQMPATEGLRRRLKTFRSVESGLQKLRDGAYTRKLTGVQTEEGYVHIQHPLMEFANELGFGTGNFASYGRTLYAVSLAKTAESLTRSIGTHILVQEGARPAEHNRQVTAFASYAYLQEIAIGEYEAGGTPEDIRRLQAARADADEQGEKRAAEAKEESAGTGETPLAPPKLEEQTQLIASGASAVTLTAEGITSDSWFADSTLVIDAYRIVEQHLADQAVSEASRVSSEARNAAIVNVAIVAAVLASAFAVAALMARSMSRSMRKLRRAAFDVAEQKLPGLVDQLSRTDPGRVDTEVEPIPITSRDEIGEVARAFDQVHREAVRLASEQALLRGNVNAIFTNLSLRTQGLIQRQLTLITDLENNEADPDQLENLFKLDHLATRMRRNGENLLILAGEEPGRRWSQPVPLVDVLRAAASEVESYERVELVGIPKTEIHGAAVTDLVHLLAELLENATVFSSPQTKVRVTATRLPDGRVMIEIHDKGIGLTPEDFADINHKLAEPPTVDAAISKRMGLFVVGRLSLRHGIRVQLRPSGEQAGTTSLVMLPKPITHGGGGQEAPEDSFTVSRIVPEHQASGHTAYASSASDLGFDESRYEEPVAFTVPDDARALTAEETRPQLEAGPSGGPLFADGAPERQPSLEQSAAEHFYPGQDRSGQDYAEQPYAERDYPQQDHGNGYAEPAYGHGGDYRPDRYEESAASQEWDQGYPQEEWAGPGGEPRDWAGPASYGPEAESAASSHFDAGESVGFDLSGPSSSSTHSVTDTGLPRRERGWQHSEAPVPAQEDHTGRSAETSPDDDEWRSTNDEHWERAGEAREPKAGGVTSSGLPKRVPKANLVAGAAQQTPQGGPQVSRAPEDIRGRLSNLRRGVQQGRTAGTDPNGQTFGPNQQER